MSVQLQPDPPASGDLVRAVVRVEDGEGGYALHYLWEVAGRTFEDDSGAIQLPSLRKGAQVAVTVTASNAAGVSESLSSYTEIENSPPTVLDLKVEEKFSDEGELEGWEAQAWARDPDGDDVELEYIWLLNDRPTEVETALYRTDSLKRGDQIKIK